MQCSYLLILTCAGFNLIVFRNSACAEASGKPENRRIKRFSANAGCGTTLNNLMSNKTLIPDPCSYCTMISKRTLMFAFAAFEQISLGAASYIAGFVSP